MSHLIQVMIGILIKTRISTRIHRVLLKTILSSGSQNPGTDQALTHPEPRLVSAIMIKAIRKVLITLIITPNITPDHMETKGDPRTPQVGINSLGFKQNKYMGLG